MLGCGSFEEAGSGGDDMHDAQLRVMIALAMRSFAATLRQVIDCASGDSRNALVVVSEGE